MSNQFCLSKGDKPNGVTAAFTSLASYISGADYPGATWRGSPNYWTGRGGYTPVIIVDHIMQSSMASADSWFINRASEVSAHFGVGRDGTVYQWVGLNNSAWANGIVNKPDIKVGAINYAVTSNINLNLLSISIEHEGYTGLPLTESQYKATLELHRWLIAQNKQNISADRQHIIGHYQIDAVNRANCPGAAFPFDRLIADLNPPPPPPKDNYDPNPQKLAIGPGMIAKLTEFKLVAATAENYGTFGDGKQSQLFTTEPGVMLIAFEGDGSWSDIRVYRQIG